LELREGSPPTLPQGRDIAQHEGTARTRGFQDRQAERLVAGGGHEDRGCGHAAVELGADQATKVMQAIGSTLARLAIDAGYDVVLSNSRGPDTLADLVGRLGPKARAATAEEAAAAADIAVVTVPLKAYEAVPVEPLAG